MHVLLIGLCKCMHVTVTATGSGQNRPLWFEPEVEMISVQSYRLRQSCSKSQVYLYLSYHARRPPHLPHRHYILREHQSKGKPLVWLEKAQDLSIMFSSLAMHHEQHPAA